jgi:hypothetical protein
VALVAFPTVAICTRMVLPYPVLPAAQLVGVVLIVVCARWLERQTIIDRAGWFSWLVVLGIAYILLRHPSPWLPNNHHERFPLLVYGAGIGFVLVLWHDRRALLPWGATERARVPLVAIAFGLIAAMAVEYFYSAGAWRTRFPDPRVQVAIQSLYWKVDYWIPFMLVFPTAYLLAWLYRHTSPRLTLYAALLLVSFPWREKWVFPLEPGFANPDQHQHSLAEAWAYQLENGKQGYWGNSRDRRWAQSEAELEAAEVLRREVARGRITLDTHIVHLGPFQYLYKDNFLFSVYTGINDDGYITRYKFDWSIAGGRLRPIEDVAARLATNPPYVAVHTRDDTDEDNVDPAPFAGSLKGYTQIFNRDGVRLYRYDGASLVVNDETLSMQP